MKKGICIIFTLLLTVLITGCEFKKESSMTITTTEGITIPQTDELKIVERERSLVDSKIELLRDLNFSRGFSVSKFHANTSQGIPLGYIDYNGLKADGDHVWSVAQWGCTYNLLDATMEKDGAVISYDDGSKLLKVDTSKTGTVTLGIKGSKEYPLDEDGKYSDRKNVTDNWPHIIIGQSFDKYASLSGANKVYFELTYNMTKCDRLTDYPVDPNMHAAQFQWFVTITNTNPEKSSYLNTIWFGFSMYDTRADGGTPSGMCAYDGGKEDSTGLLIYMFSLEQAYGVKGNVVSLPSAVIGKETTLKVDAIPFIKAALKAAQKNGIFTDATMDDLSFGSTNIGFEIPGSYDCEVEIRDMNLYIQK